MRAAALVAVIAAVLGVAAPTSGARPSGAGVVDAKVRRVMVVPHAGGGRSVIVVLRADERVTTAVRVIRYRTVVARKRFVRPRRGNWLFALTLPADVAPGRVGVVVRLTDRQGNRATFRKPVTVPTA